MPTPRDSTSRHPRGDTATRKGAEGDAPSDLSPPPKRRSAPSPASVRRTEPLEIVLVGCGESARAGYLPALRTLESSRAILVHCLVESDPHARAIVQVDFPHALAVASLDSAVAPPDSLAIIASPCRFHGAHAAAAMKRGWHVLCASPLAPTVREANAMLAASKRHERLLTVDLPHRYLPAARFLRTLCQDHLLGPAIQFRIHEGIRREVPAPLPPAPERLETPDPVLSELGVGPLDLLSWSLGPGTVMTYADDAMGGVEANASIELAFPEGVRGSVQLSREWTTERSCTFVFERGIVRWDLRDPLKCTLHLASAPASIHGELVPSLSATRSPFEPPAPSASDPRVDEIREIVRAIRRRETSHTPATETMPALALIEECYARRTPLALPWLREDEAIQAKAAALPMELRRA